MLPALIYLSGALRNGLQQASCSRLTSPCARPQHSQGKGSAGGERK